MNLLKEIAPTAYFFFVTGVLMCAYLTFAFYFFGVEKRKNTFFAFYAIVAVTTVIGFVGGVREAKERMILRACMLELKDCLVEARVNGVNADFPDQLLEEVSRFGASDLKTVYLGDFLIEFECLQANGSIDRTGRVLLQQNSLDTDEFLLWWYYWDRGFSRIGVVRSSKLEQQLEKFMLSKPAKSSEEIRKLSGKKHTRGQA